MRDIKFRAWDKVDKKIIKIDEINFFLGSVGVYEDRLFDYGVSLNQIMLDDVILMQYTGYRDKNNTKIYEGDIVKYFTYNLKTEKVEERIEIVEFIYGQWSLTSKNDDFAYRLEVAVNFEDDLEVIGNIYQNPELLENAETNS